MAVPEGLCQQKHETTTTGTRGMMKCTPKQQVQVHPLLQSLDLKLPSSLHVSAIAQKANVRYHVPHHPAASSSNSRGVQLMSGMQLCSLQPTCACTASAKSLNPSEVMLVNKQSAQQLLGTLIADQHRNQSKAKQHLGLATLRKQLQAVCSNRSSPQTSELEQVATSLADVSRRQYGVTSLLTPFAQTQQQAARRPVTAHATRPYQSDAFRHTRQVQPANVQQLASTSQAEAGCSYTIHQAAVPYNKPAIAEIAARPLLQQLVGHTMRQPHTTADVRPGSAAAHRLLRSVQSQTHRSQMKAGITKTVGAGAAARRVTHEPEQNTLVGTEPHRLSQAGAGQAAEQGLIIKDLPHVLGHNVRQQAVDERIAALTAVQHDRKQWQQQPQCNPADDTSGSDISRPATSFVRAMLTSSSGSDPGITDRLAYYQMINSVNDDLDGVDIVYDEAVEDTEEETERWREGPSSRCAAAQAAPMVLNLEDLAQSTSEVLELELDALTHDQLLQLKCMLNAC